MRRTISQLALLILPLAAAPQAQAQSASDRSDLQCVYLAAAMVESKDSTAQQAGTILFYYFYGKLEGRSPDMDFEKAFIDVIQTTKPVEMEAIGRRCGAEMETRGKQLKLIGQDMVSLGSHAPGPVQ